MCTMTTTSIFIFENQFTKREGHTHFSIFWLIPQMFTMARAGPDKNFHLCLLHGWQGFKHLTIIHCFFFCFVWWLTGCWTRSRAVWDICDFTHYTTVLVPISSLKKKNSHNLIYASPYYQKWWKQDPLFSI